MNYDSLEYGRQVKELLKQNQERKDCADANEKLCRFKRTDRLTPVYTICLYHGTELWDGPRSLKDMMNFGKDHFDPICENITPFTKCFCTKG